jgi:hypothetical protein
MKARITYPLIGLLAVGLAAADHVSGAVGDPAAAPNQEVSDLLSGIDFVPGKSTLDQVLTDPEGDLIDLANDDELDSGLRIRAIRALGLYPGQQTEDALRDLIAALLAGPSGGATGRDSLLIRAATYALASVDPLGSVAVIGPLLDHPSRDLRTDAAHALGLTGQPGAIPLLQERRDRESEGQVLWAINEALRTLSEM